MSTYLSKGEGIKPNEMNETWKETPSNNLEEERLQDALGIHPVLCRLLVQRGIRSYKEAHQFFRPEFSKVHDPFQMQDMHVAVRRLHRAIQHKEKILLYGDYDVDGVTSVAMLYSFLKEIGVSTDYYIPHRYKEGYGISFQAIDFASEKDYQLIIAMDCGIRASEQVARARSYGIDCIICDHHEPEKDLPPAVAVLNPKRMDCAYPFKELSGCGVTFKLIQAYVQQQNLPQKLFLNLLDLVAISIASDIVQMTGENRTLAHFGLLKLKETKRIGLQMLIQKSNIQQPYTISDIVFGLAPRLNAAGRLDDARHAVNLLIAGTMKEAKELVSALEYQNTLRKEFDRRLVEEALDLEATHKSLVLFKEHWHKGVLGIAAAKLAKRYFRPSVVLSASNELITGSARSVGNFDLYQALQMCEDLLVNFGGHRHAAGLSLRRTDLIPFTDRFEAAVQLLSAEEPFENTLYYTPIQLADITPSFWKILKQFAPFGPANRNPTFYCSGVVDTGFSRILKGEHLRLSIKQGQSDYFTGIGFGMGVYYETIKTKQPFDICFSIQENHWQGETHLQLMVKGIRTF